MTNLEKIEFIDEFLSELEDVLHGIDGRDCTKSRKYLEELKQAINYSHCCTQFPTFDESNLNKNEYANDVQEKTHKNLCKPSYKIGWENCYARLKQNLKN